MADYYDLLGVSKSASQDEIKKAFRKQAMKYHPDRNKGDKAAEEQFKKINEAYAVLSDSTKKAQYDRFGDTQFHQQYSTDDIFRGTDFNSIFAEFGFGGGGDIFSQMFQQGGGGQSFHGFSRGPQKGQDVEYELEIGFMEAYAGVKRPIAFSLDGGPKRELTVSIPAGIATGDKLRVAGRGAPSRNGGPDGDLFLKIKVAEHPSFTREGNDILTPAVVRISDAFFGGSGQVATPEGERTIKIPVGIKPGTRIRIKGQGFPVRGGSERGDLFCVVEVSYPDVDSLSEGQRDALLRLKEEGL